MKIGSLFSGYGGLDLGVMSVLGGEVAWHVEFDDAPSRILAHHWPDVPNYGDVTKVDWSSVQQVDVITAGYPCQPFSLSGKRKGSADERHLWPYVLGAVRHLRPRLVVLENVRGHLTLGFDRVLGDLAEAGYDAQWVCIPASAAGAPHRRERIFILAHAAGVGLEWAGQAWSGGNGSADSGDASPDAGSARLREHTRGSSAEEAGAVGSDEPASPRGSRPAVDWGPYLSAIVRWEHQLGRVAPAPTAPTGRDGKQQLSTRFEEWMMGLPEGHVTGIGLTRGQEAKALGNGVVPQQAALALRLLGVSSVG
ncbi:DNA (cytosine-5)-methyltransferase 1 [Microbacterium sp. BE35]|uniref:DNA cytosine methyltransferase n=1 Tax=Microbacterium sp. BE35 TaxID=2817773 RepID=UPI002856A1F9|nr:DNA cytosine methyltransferase [Microbacterium sp. BE35]MDR7189762.1 DNA (cytosine-5)-methyltransferase 1 [Microbacterium sp. BE35]